MLTVTLVAIVVIVLVYMAVYHKIRDPYGTFHVRLNILPGEVDARTEWLNMGYWKDTAVFPQACEALALKTARAANCIPGGRVLDVGHGSGDSLLLQLKHLLIPRPSLLVGITSLQEHHARSLERTSHFLTQFPSSTQVKLVQSDAIARGSDLDHPLSPSSDLPLFTSIVAIDCAYHFNTRALFLRQAFGRLAPEGRIALADICFDKPSTLISLLAGVVAENMISREQYVCTLQEIGYKDIELEDISYQVFPGFTRFLGERGGTWRLMAMAMNFVSTRGARFVMVSARKPSSESGG